MIKTDLHDVSYLGALRAGAGELPYFLFSAKPCQDCLQDTSLHLIRPNDSRPQTFTYPGRILDSKTRTLLLESRAFFGRCLTQTPNDVYIVFQKERVDRRRHLQSSVYIAEAGPDHLDERLLERRLPSVSHSLTWVKRKSCREISGRYRMMLRKPLDLRSTNLKEEREDDDEVDEIPEEEAATQPLAPSEGARLVAPTPLPSKR
ncbi:MAG: hypothetical protein NDJ89_13890 [Oligoflexia bacterium]|nr:hypothetical protein [Oligoflexia bacterium]